MYVLMFFQISLLSKSLIASLKFAHVRFFLRVDSQMVKEIVPFPKDFVTARMGAVQQPYDSPLFV